MSSTSCPYYTPQAQKIQIFNKMCLTTTFFSCNIKESSAGQAHKKHKKLHSTFIKNQNVEIKHIRKETHK